MQASCQHNCAREKAGFTSEKCGFLDRFFSRVTGILVKKVSNLAIINHDSFRRAPDCSPRNFLAVLEEFPGEILGRFGREPDRCVRALFDRARRIGSAHIRAHPTW